MAITLAIAGQLILLNLAIPCYETEVKTHVFKVLNATVWLSFVQNQHVSV